MLYIMCLFVLSLQNASVFVMAPLRHRDSLPEVYSSCYTNELTYIYKLAGVSQNSPELTLVIISR